MAGIDYLHFLEEHPALLFFVGSIGILLLGVLIVFFLDRRDRRRRK